MPRQAHRSRTLLHAIGYTLIGLALLLTLLPQIVGQGLRYTLTSYGTGAVELENVDINLFNGTFAVDGLQLYRSAAQLMQVGHAEIEIDWSGLLQRRIAIRHLHIDDLSITVEQKANAELRIAGFTLPGAANDNTSVSSKKSLPWGVGIAELTVDRSAIQLIRPGLSHTLFIDALTMGSAQSWNTQQQTPLSAAFRLADSTLSLKASGRPFADSADANVQLQLEGLDLGLAQPLLASTATALSGKLTAEMTLSLQQQSGHFTLEQSGDITLDQLQVQQPQMTLEGKRIAWQGKSRLQLSGEKAGGQLDGKLSGRQLSLQLPKNALQLSLAAIDWQGNITLPDNGSPEALSSSGALSLDSLAAFRVGTKSPHTQLKTLQLQKLVLKGVQDIRIETISLSGLQGQLTLTQQGLEPLNFHYGSASEASAGANSADKAGPGTALRIGGVTMSGDNRLRFEDRTVKPVFSQQLTVKRLNVGTLDTRAPDTTTPFNMEAFTDEHGQLSINGEGTPLASQPKFSLQASLQDYEMPPLTSYLVKQIGYRINSGQLDTGLELTIADNTMKGELKLKARQLEMQPEDPARIQEFEKKSSMPVNTALGLLRDSDNNIVLTIPLSGQLDDPQFDLSDAFNSALAKTMRSATVSYLKFLLQPYSSVITLVQLAGKAGGGIHLEPIRFSAGSTEITEPMQAYIGKLAELARKDKKLRLRLCGFATTADKRALSGDKQGMIAEEGDPELEVLAKNRAEVIKRDLVETYGIAPGQLFICHPSLDREAEAIPRLELQL